MKFSGHTLFAGVSLVLASVVFIGCSGDTASPPTEPAEVSSDWKVGLDDDVVTALSQLSDADREAALAQKVCPVTGKQLGSMGKPLKVTVKGQEVFLCCEGCEEEIKANPDKYL